MSIKKPEKLRVVILAAGEGTRMKPVMTPKVLIPFDGVPNLQRTLDILEKSNEVEEVIVVCPYSSDYSKLVTPTSKSIFLNNQLSKISNNITSFLMADYPTKSWENSLTGVLLLEGDQRFNERKLELMLEVLSVSYEQSKMFLRQRGAGEWLPTTNSDHLFESYSLSKDGDYAMGGATYLTKRDYLKVKDELLSGSLNVNLNQYWENALLASDVRHRVSLETGFNHYAEEFDNILDLIRLTSYDNVARLISKNSFIERISESMTNRSYYIIDKYNETKVLRLPGAGTDQFIDRSREEYIHNLAYENGISTPKSVYYKNGVKITDYVNAKYLTYHKDNHILAVARELEKLHSIPLDENLIGSDYCRDVMFEINVYKDMAGKYNKYDDQETYDAIWKYFERHKFTQVRVTHGDLIPYNLLFDKDNNLYLIDWEYAGIGYVGIDYGAYISEYVLNSSDEKISLSRAPGQERLNRCIREDLAYFIWSNLGDGEEELITPQEMVDWSYITDYLWGVWGLAKTAVGEDNLEYGIRRIEYAKYYFTK